MRTWGRPKNPDGTNGPWTLVQTEANGRNDHVMLTALAQVLLLNMGESPFWADWGIPAKYSVISQLFPDYSVTLTQQRFASSFAALLVAREDDPTPTYNITATTNVGVVLNRQVPIPI
jgi:hypothetical protein